ncbi:hypothetical protein EDD85DRAFT_793198 [Armillaria nabsnona]|nr:hypothetical protein EDD85DRAFT_793198 [Armillaria nabsnona]
MAEIPTLDELGLPEATASVHRGENEALRRLENRKIQKTDDRTGMKTPKIDYRLEFKEDIQGSLGTTQSCDRTDFPRKNGADAKAKYLIDWDPGANPGNWMCTNRDFRSRLQRYSVPRQEQQERAVKFCPELAQFPDKYIYSPISLPQIFKRKKAGGRAVEYDYPAPILDPELEKKQCMIRIKDAYAQGFHETNHEIPDGSADDILRGSYKEALGQVD